MRLKRDNKKITFDVWSTTTTTVQRFPIRAIEKQSFFQVFSFSWWITKVKCDALYGHNTLCVTTTTCAAQGTHVWWIGISMFYYLKFFCGSRVALPPSHNNNSSVKNDRERTRERENLMFEILLTFWPNARNSNPNIFHFTPRAAHSKTKEKRII